MPGPLRAKLNPIYEPLLGPLFDRPEIVEERATCDNCAMCDHGQGVQLDVAYFKPDAKCCTYYPMLPNYLVGGILADPDPALEEGRRRLRERIASRIGVTPGWLAPPRKVTVISAAARSVFGRSAALRCPYFDIENGGRCTIWKYRENVCTTYFCKFTNGKPGWDFWHALKEYLGHLEVMLSNYAVKTIDPLMTEPTIPRLQLTVEDLEDRAPNDADYASYWSTWRGREEEFYIACYEKVRSVARSDFQRFVDGSEKGAELLETVRVRWDEMTNRTVLPKNLVRNPKMKERYLDDAVVVTSYNPFDSFKMDRDLFDVLAHFEAKESVERNLQRLRDEHGAELEPELLAYLYTHGVLVAPGENLLEKAPPVTAGKARAAGPAPSKVVRTSKKNKKRR